MKFTFSLPAFGTVGLYRFCFLLFLFFYFLKNPPSVQAQADPPHPAVVAFLLSFIASGIAFLGFFLAAKAFVAQASSNEQTFTTPVHSISAMRTQRTGNSSMSCQYTVHYQYQNEWLFLCTSQSNYEASQKNQQFVVQGQLAMAPMNLGVKILQAQIGSK